MAYLGYGSEFEWNGNVVGEMVSIGSPALSSDAIDVTTHQSPDGYMEFIQGLINAGTLPLSGYFKPSDATGQVAMLTDMNNRTVRSCTVRLPGGIASWTFNAFLTAWSLGEQTASSGIPFSATIQITGKPTLSIGVSAGLTTPYFAVSDDAVIAPAPAAAVYDYVATVATGVSSVTVTPTASAGAIKVNGNVVASGNASSAIALGAAGSVTQVSIQVQESGKAAKTYTLRIVRAAS